MPRTTTLKERLINHIKTESEKSKQASKTSTRSLEEIVDEVEEICFEILIQAEKTDLDKEELEQAKAFQDSKDQAAATSALGQSWPNELIVKRMGVIEEAIQNQIIPIRKDIRALSDSDWYEACIQIGLLTQALRATLVETCFKRISELIRPYSPKWIEDSGPATETTDIELPDFLAAVDIDA